MKNKILIALLFLPIIGLASTMLWYEHMTHFDRVEVVVQGYDPKDFFSGYYMRLQPNWEQTDCTQFADKICPKDDFEKDYTFYMNQKHSDDLGKAVNAGVVKLVFSYQHGHNPLIVDLLVDGKSYIDFIKESKSGLTGRPVLVHGARNAN